MEENKKTRPKPRRLADARLGAERLQNKGCGHVKATLMPTLTSQEASLDFRAPTWWTSMFPPANPY